MNQKITYASEAEYDEAISKAKEKHENVKTELEATYLGNDEFLASDKIKALELELVNLKKPWEDKIVQLREQRDEHDKRVRQLEAERKDLTELMKVKQAQQKGEMDAESVTAFLALHKIKDYGSTIKLKKELLNGIKAFQEKPEEKFHQWNKLFLFKGTDFVGFWRKRDSKHPGDDVYSQAWIGVEKLTKDEGFDYKKEEEGKKGNDIEELEFTKLEYDAKNGGYKNREKHVFYREKGYNNKTDPTMQQFLNYAETFKGDLVAIDVTDEKTRDILYAEPS